MALLTKDGKVWLNQQQMAELFATSKPNISIHISNILKEKELDENSVVKNHLTTAADGKNYNVVFYIQKQAVRAKPKFRSIGLHTGATTMFLFASANRYLQRIKGAGISSILVLPTQGNDQVTHIRYYKTKHTPATLGRTCCLFL